MNLSIVVPCYNESEILDFTIESLLSFLSGLINDNIVSNESEILFVDDGSKDDTWDVIVKASKKDEHVKGVRLSRNKGHQNALCAGMERASGDFIVTIDADLQDDIQTIKSMIAYSEQGADIVLGVRKERTVDSFFKRVSANAFYNLMRFFKVELVFNHADFRGMSHRAVAALLEYSERNLFLRGIVPQLGYPTMLVYYDRKERIAGETKYPLKKMLSFAWDGITSFSIFPLRLITAIGFLLFLLSCLTLFWALSAKFLFASTVPGWASTIAPFSLFCGVQLLGLGIIGEYLGKIYLEVKRRPRFFISETAGFKASPEEGSGKSFYS